MPIEIKDRWGCVLYASETGDWGGVDLAGKYLVHAKLEGAELCGATLLGANLVCADLSGANLRHSDLERANLTNADLRGANLRGADTNGTEFWDAKLGGVTMEWGSHSLIAEILRQNAKASYRINDSLYAEKLKVAGLIAIQRDWCWPDFIALKDPLTNWVLDTLVPYVKKGDNAPEVLKKRARKLAREAKKEAEVTDGTD